MASHSDRVIELLDIKRVSKNGVNDDELK